MSDELLTSLLRDVSRSFYLPMRILPRAVRRPISLAYLLARTTDTIADTDLVPVESRLEALRALRERILGRNSAPLNWTLLLSKQSLAAERVLLERHEESLRVLELLDGEDRQRIRDVLDIIISGQELDLQRFGKTEAGQIIALESPAELDDYTYRVAGCVGEFWTKICRAHLFPGSDVDEKKLIGEGILFGKGQQLVNILRDIPPDLRKGRCYIPRQLLAPVGLKPADLLRSENEPRFRAVYNPLLAKAEDFLRTGWRYTGSLPRIGMRLRLACAWPLLIGAGTMRRLRAENILDATHRIKITRSELKSIIARSIILYPFPRSWNDLFEGELKKFQGRV